MERLGALVLGMFLLLTATPGSVSGQTSALRGPEVTPETLSTSTEHSSSDQPALQKRNPRYRVHADDVLAITFPLSPELDQPNVAVQPDGYINVLDADSVYVQGLSAPEIAETLKKAYAGTLHDPIINVDLVDFQKPYFLASGQVGKPGQYDLRHETTVSEGIAIAGGLVPTAKTQVFLFHRVSTNWVEVKKLNLNDLLRGKNANEDAYLAPGDSIFVPEKFITKFRKYIPYGIGTSISPSPAFY